jgi:hypothetical protein
MDRTRFRSAAVASLLVVLVAACGSAATASPSSTVGAHSSLTATATPSPSPVVATPSPTASPSASPTPALKSLDSITGAPLPKTAVTAQNVTDAMSPVLDYYAQHPDLDPNVGSQLSSKMTTIMNQCLGLDKSIGTDPKNRLVACEGYTSHLWTDYIETGNAVLYDATEIAFNYVVGPNGVPNTPSIPDVRRDLTGYLGAV